MIVDVLRESLKAKFETEFRDGVHVSDLCLCPRKSAARRLENTGLTMMELGFFTSGRAIHDAIQTLASYKSSQFEIEKELVWNGIQAHVDLYDTQGNIPIECKTVRVKEMPEPKTHHLQQLKMYMVMLDADRGIMLYQLLNHFGESPFVEFEVAMSQKEREDMAAHMLREAKWFSDSIQNNQPMTARNVLLDKKLNWLCRNCPYLKRCNDLHKANAGSAGGA